jgi:hypothetical protein
MGYRAIFIFIVIFLTFSTNTSAAIPLKAAFIRDHQLSMIEGDKEQQLTTGKYVFQPKWSYDGRFIAYLEGDENGEKTTLFIYDTQQKECYQPYPMVETWNFQWSPITNQLAYNAGGVLNVTKTKDSRPKGFENVSLGVSDFAWFPNGKEFVVSSQSNLLPTGWEPVHLFKVQADANLDQNKIKPFYTIETNETDLFAIDASYFKWSADHNWVSFLAIPTASWSNDSNTLCVLSAKGDQFQAVGKMLINEDWIKWAPTENQLAYISGEGRFHVQDKKTTVADIPISKQQKDYTPKGYVDLDLEWLSPNEVIVARAKENKEWNEGPMPTMFTTLHVINLKSTEQKQISFPKKGERDVWPQVIGPYITWVRIGEQRDVWISKGLNSQPQKWIQKVDDAPVFWKQGDGSPASIMLH